MSSAEALAAAFESVSPEVDRFHRIADSSAAPIYTTDERGQITYYNQAGADFWGRRPQLGTSCWCGSRKLYWPDGTPLPQDECPVATVLNERRSIRGLQAIAGRPDGTRAAFMPYPTPCLTVLENYRGDQHAG
jgi:PAS domain-containing protein